MVANNGLQVMPIGGLFLGNKFLWMMFCPD
jgi:hypothetical protein